MKLLGCFLAFGFVCSAADIAVVEEIIAKVNGDIVTRGDIDHSRKSLEAEMRQKGANGITLQQAMALQEKDLLRDRLDQLLLVQKAKDLDIKVDSEMTKYLASLQKESGLADPEKFQDWVHQQTGMPFEDFKADTKNNMLTQHVIRQEVAGRIPVKHEEVQKYYEEHKKEFVRSEQLFLREILVSTDNKDAAGMAAAEKKAKDLVARARKGERFPEMARDNSDSLTAKTYGDLGSYKKGDLDPAIESQVWDKPKGYVTDPIKVKAGYLILRVDDHPKEGQAELEEVENEIDDKLITPRMGVEVRKYLTQLRQDAFLEIKAGWVDTGAAPGKNTAWADPGQLKPETVTKAELPNKKHHKKLLWIVPIPGTTSNAPGTSTSK
jgi:peptidyl-prolyl cis-trans isomerase SurA